MKKCTHEEFKIGDSPKEVCPECSECIPDVDAMRVLIKELARQLDCIPRVIKRLFIK